MSKLSPEKTLLLLIDLQNDFCLGGALAVDGGDEVIEPLNHLAVLLAAKGGRIAASQDWHPPGHVSFASSQNGKKPGDLVDTALVKGQILWPEHCIQGKEGAAFHDWLDIKPISMIIRKGFRKDLDSYSAFFENDQKTPTGLEGWLRSLGMETVIIGGLATEFCVFYSATDSKKLGFNTIVISDAVRPAEINEGSAEKAITAMKSEGIEFLTSDEISGILK